MLPVTEDKSPDHYRVMVVDDSAVVRGLETRYLEAQPGIKVVGSYANGRDAVNALERLQVDVVVLDLQMPVMDGITALPLILEAQPAAKVLISSALTHRNAAISLECLEKGASDYISKPEAGTRDANGSDEFYRDMHRKILALGAASRDRRGLRHLHLPLPASIPAPSSKNQSTEQLLASVRQTLQNKLSPLGSPTPAARTVPREEVFNPALASPSDIKLRHWPDNFRVDAVAIGSSTGGPQALFTVLKHLKGIRQPIFLTQHMPPTFTTILAEHIVKQAGVEAAEAKEGETVVGGRLYLAPGSFHMIAERKGVNTILHLDESPPENFCRPAVDPMLRSLVPIYGSRLLTVILTGMGSDGAKGSEKVVEQGGAVIAQDAATSVVWGMPGAAATSGVCSAVLPLEQIGPEILRLVSR